MELERFSESVLSHWPDLSTDGDLLTVGNLKVEKKGESFAEFDELAAYWRGSPLALEFIEGEIFAREDPAVMMSNVYLFDLKESLGNGVVTIRTEMTGSNFGPLEDFHCSLVLYALAMDLKHRYPSAKDTKEKKKYIAIISQ
jgi:hypothetical protein